MGLIGPAQYSPGLVLSGSHIFGFTYLKSRSFLLVVPAGKPAGFESG
jgi:hypothetical protein